MGKELRTPPHLVNEDGSSKGTQLTSTTMIASMIWTLERTSEECLSNLNKPWNEPNE